MDESDFKAILREQKARLDDALSAEFGREWQMPEERRQQMALAREHIRLQVNPSENAACEEPPPNAFLVLTNHLSKQSKLG
jgi:hypothetical protein